MTDASLTTSITPVRSRRRAPGPRGHFLLGSLPDMREDSLKFLLSLPEQYGDVVRLRFGPATLHLIRRPEHVGHVLQDNYQNYSKDTHGFNVLRRILGNGLLTSDGDFWRRQRRIAQPAFHRQYIAGFAKLMTDAAATALDGWQARAQSTGELDVFEELSELTLTIVGETLLGTDMRQEAGAVADAVTVVVQDANRRVTAPLPIPDWLPTANNRRFRKARTLLDRIVYRVIAERRQEPKEGDLLGMLMAARDAETGEGMSDRQLRDEVMTIFLSGHETTASALTWTLSLLSDHPHVRARLEEEVDSALAGRTPEARDLQALPYTKMVLQESMRLYPPAWMVTRRAEADDEIGGYHIPKGSYVFASPLITQRLEQLYPDPERFDPERFRAEGPQAKLHRFAYYPFGGGPRGCIGNGFALMEATLVLAMMVQRYRLERSDSAPVELDPLVSLRPKRGLRMRIERRHP